MNAADVVARRLAAEGVREVYGIPGGEVLTLVRAIEAAGMRFVLCKHENSGGFMAEGGFHANGAPGVLLATLGPGVANAVNVVAHAWQDRVPLVFLTGCVDAVDAATYTHQVFDHRALLAPVTKASVTLADGAADVIIDRAVSLAMADPPGPVHVDVPIQVAAASVPDRPMRRLPRARSGAPVGDDVDTARRWLGEARRPVLLVGMEVLHQRGERQLRAWAAEQQLPVITTYKAKGVVDETDPWCLGGAGLSPVADQVLLPLVADSDCIVLAGYDPIEMRIGWRNPWPADARVIEFRSWHDDSGMHDARLRFVGDIVAGLAAIGDGVAVAARWPGGEIGQARRQLDQAFRSAGHWGPGAVIEVAREALPAHTVATVDSGAHRILFNQAWQCRQPRRLLQSTGLCTMGCALPLAIGYARADADAVVAVFTGDAGLEMVLGELATLRDARRAVLVFVFVDASLALIEKKQRELGHDNVGVDFPGTDFVAVAEALGGRGVAVASRTALAQAIDEALNEDERFTLFACQLDRAAYDGTF